MTITIYFPSGTSKKQAYWWLIRSNFKLLALILSPQDNSVKEALVSPLEQD
ncbi:MAG: hypothetical protein KKH61_21150 [Gammaproteobacteria bacterium]|nr:hypothetical protein [Gammaproteobacteria bacterium]